MSARMIMKNDYSKRSMPLNWGVSKSLTTSMVKAIEVVSGAVLLRVGNSDSSLFKQKNQNYRKTSVTVSFAGIIRGRFNGLTRVSQPYGAPRCVNS